MKKSDELRRKKVEQLSLSLLIYNIGSPVILVCVLMFLNLTQLFESTTEQKPVKNKNIMKKLSIVYPFVYEMSQ